MHTLHGIVERRLDCWCCGTVAMRARGVGEGLVMAPWLDCDGLVKGLALAGPWGWESCESHGFVCLFGFVSDGHCCVECLGAATLPKCRTSKPISAYLYHLSSPSHDIMAQCDTYLSLDQHPPRKVLCEMRVLPAQLRELFLHNVLTCVAMINLNLLFALFLDSILTSSRRCVPSLRSQPDPSCSFAYQTS